MMSVMTFSTMLRKPRAPVSRSLALRAIIFKAPAVELEFGPFHLEELVILANQSVARLGENADQRLFVERIERSDDRQPADELRESCRTRAGRRC